MVKKGLQASALVVANVLLLSACGGGGSSTDTVDSVSIVDDSSGTDDNSGTCDNPVTSLPTIFLEFNTSPNVTAVLSSDGCYVTVEANGKPKSTFLAGELLCSLNTKLFESEHKTFLEKGVLIGRGGGKGRVS